jgi:2-methylcitrate dehydratase
MGGVPEATLLGGGRSSAPLAALANGTALRFLDANDYHFGRDPAHPSGVLPVALACCERADLGGRELLAALVAGYEIHLRLADHAGAPSLWRRGFHHSTNLGFAAAACAARLLGLDAERAAHAMAIAGTHAVTLAQLQSGRIANIKASAEAYTAKTGLEAALLARHGVTGPMAILEGPSGWVRAVAGEAELAAIAAPFAAPWKLSGVCIKPYAAVATAMAPVQAALDLVRLDGVRADDIRAVTVKLPRFPLGTPSAAPDRRFPATRESADHSFWYCACIALLDSACGEAQFDMARLADPALLRLLACTELEEDPALTANWPAAGGAVAVRLADGRVLERRHAWPPGHPRNPLDQVGLEAKFHEYADPVLGRPRAAALAQAVWGLEGCASIRDLMAMVEPAA